LFAHQAGKSIDGDGINLRAHDEHFADSLADHMQFAAAAGHA
jgi:hypothetical protein